MKKEIKNLTKDLANETGKYFIDVILDSMKELTPISGAIFRAIDRKKNEKEMIRIEKLINFISEDINRVEINLTKENEKEKFSNFFSDVIEKVKITNGDKLIKSYSHLTLNTAKENNIDDGIFALSILNGFTEHHLNVLNYMMITNYNNAKKIITSITGNGNYDLPVKNYRNALFTFTQEKPLINMSYIKEGNEECDIRIIDALEEIEYPTVITQKIANDLKYMGLATSPTDYTFTNDPNKYLYIHLTDLGIWLSNITNIDN